MWKADYKREGICPFENTGVKTHPSIAGFSPILHMRAQSVPGASERSASHSQIRTPSELGSCGSATWRHPAVSFRVTCHGVHAGWVQASTSGFSPSAHAEMHVAVLDHEPVAVQHAGHWYMLCELEKALTQPEPIKVWRCAHGCAV